MGCVSLERAGSSLSRGFRRLSLACRRRVRCSHASDAGGHSQRFGLLVRAFENLHLDALAELQRRRFKKGDASRQDPAVGWPAGILRTNPPPADDIGDLFNDPLPGLAPGSPQRGSSRRSLGCSG